MAYYVTWSTNVNQTGRIESALMFLLMLTCYLPTLMFGFFLQWLTRRQAHLQRAQQGIPVSEYGVRVLYTSSNLVSSF